MMVAGDDSSGDGPAADGHPPAEPADAQPSMPPQQPRWSEPIFRAGLVVGSGLFLVGVACQTLNLIAPTVSILIICSGLGIIFGAFGSTAVINYKGFVVAGVAAIAIVLLLIVDYVMRESIVRLEVDGDVRGARLELFGDTTYPGADHDGRLFEFFIVGREITKDRLSLIVTLPMPAADRSGGDPSEITFDCIPSTAITHYIGSGKTLQWRFDKERGLLIGVDGRTVQSGPCPEQGATGPTFALGDGLSLVGSAVAQDQDIDKLLNDLQSDSAAVRRDARMTLSSLGQAAVPPMMTYWEQNPASDRVRLGVSVALTEFLRGHKDQRQAVSALLTDSQLRFLAIAATDPDRTLRIYAAEFLFDLGDTRIVSIAESLFSDASDDGRYNLVLIIRGAVPDLSPPEKTVLAGTLRGWQAMVGPNTQELIASVMKILGS
jgi:hypothetical protein